tara:strand:- start:92 stop:532 length:441 start_codon:yes stop_codon:yes gene_type:complete
MPFADFNRENLPNIIITLNNEDITDESYDEFVNEMNKNDEIGEEYTLYWNLTNCTKVYPVKYLSRISKYIKSRKGKPDNHLKFSIMHAKSTTVRTMLRFILNLTSPSAPLCIIKEVNEELLNELYTKITEEKYDELPKGVIKFMPK